MDQRRRQIGETVGAQGRDARIVGREAFDTVIVPVAGHRRLVDEIAARQLFARARTAERLHHRAEQNLQREPRARGARDDHGEIGARGIAADRQSARIDAEALRVGADRAQSRDAVLDRGGKAMLGREAIVHRNDAAISPARQRRAQRVMRFEAAGDPAAAVKINERRKFGLRSPWRAIVAQRQRRRVVGQALVAPFDFGRSPREGRQSDGRSPQIPEVGRAGAFARARGEEVEEAARAPIETDFIRRAAAPPALRSSRSSGSFPA